MKRLAGQAGRTVGYLLHHTGMLIITLFFVMALGLGGVAYRLSLGPIEIPWLTSRLASAVSGQGIDIHIAQAALAWGGYKNGGGVPLFLQLGDIVARNSAGVELADIPKARLVFLPGALVGTRAPIMVTSADALFAGSDVPVSMSAAISLGFLHLSEAVLNFTLGPGALGAGGMSVPISGGGFSADIRPDKVSLRNGRLTLARVAGAAPLIGFSGEATLGDDWRGTLVVTVDSVPAAALKTYWPPDLVVQTRAWVTGNITAGTASNAVLTLGLSAPKALTGLALNSATGHFDGTGLAVGWIPGAAPITGVTGTLNLTDEDDIKITASSGALGGVTLSGGTLAISGVTAPVQQAVLNVPIAGPVAAALAVLGAPPLNLLKLAPPPLRQMTGDMTGTVVAKFPLKNDLPLQDVDLHVLASLTGVAAPTPIKGLDFSAGRIDLQASIAGLQATGTAALGDEPSHFTAKAGFGAGQPVIAFHLDSLAGPRLLQPLGLTATGDDKADVAGTAPLAVQVDQDAAGVATVAAQADLTPVALALPVFGWSKKAGEAGDARLDAQIAADGTVRVQSIRAAAPDLSVMAVSDPDDPDTLRFDEIRIGATMARGTVGLPPHPGLPWMIVLSGQALDLSAMLSQTDHAVAGAKAAPAGAGSPGPVPPSGPRWLATLNFERLKLSGGNAPALHGLAFSGSGQGGRVLNGQARATDDDGKVVTLSIGPAADPGAAEAVRLQTADVGYLLRAMGLYDNIENGTGGLTARWEPDGGIAGEVRIDDFRLLHAPLIGKILQGMTLYGVADATSGPGLVFDRLVAPFSLGTSKVTLTGARAFSSSLGFTASGTIGLGDGMADLNTTIVPAYFLNAAPGKIPVLGKLFSAETGGGLFAMQAKITGSLGDPDISVNPLSALTPGVLRDVFGLGPGLHNQTAATP